MSTIHRAMLLSLVLVCAAAPSPAAQQSHPLEGMWSDPPNTLGDRFCGAFCTDAGLRQLEKLLDDPANDARPYRVLAGEAQAFQNERYINPLLTPGALKNFPLDPTSDPGFLRCEPWGLARQIFAPHQLHITVRRDRIDMRYGEWDARRTVFLDGRPRPLNQPPTPLGHSIGRFEGEALSDLPAGYVGGFITSTATATRLPATAAAVGCTGGPCGRGLESDPPGYRLPAISTARLWKAR